MRKRKLIDSKKKLIETKKVNERGILVALGKKGESDEILEEHLSELEFLAKTLDVDIEKSFIQKLENPDPRTFIGKGKLQEIKEFIGMKKSDLIVFDDDLSPSQLRNLEKELKIKIYDRSLLILDIFLRRAKTSQAKTQVELARFQYLLPRLTRMWTHLERQRGGTSTRGGAGEKEIETDRRIIRDRITLLRSQLNKIEKQAATRRKSRVGIVRVALVGYTNVGKSTLMNVISRENIYANDELFATLDSTVRKVVINNIPFLLSDTVGFIRKLPHNLIESFKSTLEEVREADLLLHVIDRSSPAFEDHIKVVESTLEELEVMDKPIVKVYNKIDSVNEEEYTNNGEKNAIYISAKNQTNIQEFKELVFKEVKKKHIKIYPHFLEQEYY